MVIITLAIPPIIRKRNLMKKIEPILLADYVKIHYHDPVHDPVQNLYDNEKSAKIVAEVSMGELYDMLLEYNSTIDGMSPYCVDNMGDTITIDMDDVGNYIISVNHAVVDENGTIYSFCSDDTINVPRVIELFYEVKYNPLTEIN